MCNPHREFVTRYSHRVGGGCATVASSKGAKEGVHPPRSVIASLSTHAAPLVRLLGSPDERGKKGENGEREKKIKRKDGRTAPHEYESVRALRRQ